MRAALIPLLGTLLKSIVTKVIIALGLTFISYNGYSVALNKGLYQISRYVTLKI